MAGPAYLAQKREVSLFVVPITSTHDNRCHERHAIDGLQRMILQAVENRQCEREVEVMLRRHLRRATECASIFYARDVNFLG